MVEKDSQKNAAQAVGQKAAQTAEGQKAAQKPEAKGRGKPEQKKAKVPKNIAVLAVAVVVLAALAVWASIPPQPKDGNGTESGLIKVKMVYSGECTICSDTHTFENVLNANDVNYSIERVEASSEEGAKLVYRYGIRSVPALVIGEKSVRSNLFISNPDGGILNLKELLQKELVGDAYVIYESRKNPLISAMYLKKQDTECSTGGKPLVEIFSEPYCFACITSAREIESALGAFGDGIGFKYNYFPAFAQKMLAGSTQESVDALADRLICAAGVGKYAELESAFIDLYCDNSGDGKADQSEVSYCHLFSQRYGAELSSNDIDNIVEDSNIDKAELTQCLQGIEFRRGAGMEKAPLYEITREAILPIAVIDCRYVTHAVNLKDALCGLHPELEGCTQS